MGRRVLVLATAFSLLLGACSTGAEEFVADGLDKALTTRSVSATLDPVTSDEQIKKFVEESVSQIQTVWGEFTHGNGSGELKIEYVEGEGPQQTVCQDPDYREIYRSLNLPIVCDSVLYVPMLSMHTLWQDNGMREVQGDNEAMMYVALAGSLHDYFFRSTSLYAKNEFKAYVPITIDDGHKKLFAHCIAGVLATSAFLGRPARLSPRWSSAHFSAVSMGYEKGQTPAGCYKAYWAKK